jgi:aspartyl-tRNA(Asn)/glutamyl-tRNA(Gln) amidotransferase subunit A
VSAEFDFMSACELRRLVAAREVSPVELTERALERAEATQPQLNAFFVLMPEEAQAAAHRAEEAAMKGEPLGLLHGLPISAKDLMAVAGQPYASGSRTMAGNVATVDAPAVERVKAQGAILIGKTTTSEFGCKPVGDSPLTGNTRHHWAAGITPFALGTDGGGSLRIPAAFTGLVGFKAQFGRVPVWPVSATPTLAHVGSLARTVADAALLTTAISGYDARDPFSVAGVAPDLLGVTKSSLSGLRIAWSPTLGYARPTSEVVEIASAAARRLAELGAMVEEVDRVFETDPADLWIAEFYAGVGTRLRSFVETQHDLLDPAVAAVLEAALAQDMRSYYDTVFRRYALRDEMRRFFECYDLLLSPTMPISSLETGRDIPPGLSERGLVTWVFYTYPFNLTGQPAASVCAGIASDGMPVGLQIVGRSLAGADVIRVAAGIERMHPPGYNLKAPCV